MEKCITINQDCIIVLLSVIIEEYSLIKMLFIQKKLPKTVENIKFFLKGYQEIKEWHVINASEGTKNNNTKNMSFAYSPLFNALEICLQVLYNKVHLILYKYVQSRSYKYIFFFSYFFGSIQDT